MKVELHWGHYWPDMGTIEVWEWPTYKWFVTEDDLYSMVFTEYQMKKFEEWEYSFDLNSKLLDECIHRFKIKREPIDQSCPGCGATEMSECCSFWKLHSPPK